MTMKPNKQRVPEPTLTPPQASAQSTVQQALAQQIAQRDAVPPPAPVPAADRFTFTDHGLVITNPTIRLSEFLMIGNGVQTQKLTPKQCVIWHGAIVIEELGLVLPLAGNHVRAQ